MSLLATFGPLFRDTVHLSLSQCPGFVLFSGALYLVFGLLLILCAAHVFFRGAAFRLGDFGESAWHYLRQLFLALACAVFDKSA